MESCFLSPTLYMSLHTYAFIGWSLLHNRCASLPLLAIDACSSPRHYLLKTKTHAQLSGLLPCILTCMHIVIVIRLSHVVDLMTYVFFLLSRSCTRTHTHIPCIHVYLSHMHVQGLYVSIHS